MFLAAQLYGLAAGPGPAAVERCWLAPLLLLLPALAALLFALPALLLRLPRPLVPLPGGDLCQVINGNTNRQLLCTAWQVTGPPASPGAYQASSAILGLALPLVITAGLVLGLSVRRCVRSQTTSRLFVAGS